jgi:hypothetical protein
LCSHWYALDDKKYRKLLGHDDIKSCYVPFNYKRKIKKMEGRYIMQKLVAISYLVGNKMVGIDLTNKPITKPMIRNALINPKQIVDLNLETSTLYLSNGHKYESLTDESIEVIKRIGGLKYEE